MSLELVLIVKNKSLERSNGGFSYIVRKRQRAGLESDLASGGKLLSKNRIKQADRFPLKRLNPDALKLARAHLDLLLKTQESEDRKDK